MIASPVDGFTVVGTRTGRLLHLAPDRRGWAVCGVRVAPDVIRHRATAWCAKCLSIAAPKEDNELFERFTDRSRRVVVLAQEAARDLRHPYIDPQHLMYGLAAEGEGVAAVVLKDHGVGTDEIRAAIVELDPPGVDTPSGHMPFTPAGKKIVELSLREALQLGHNYIGTEHVLMALARVIGPNIRTADADHKLRTLFDRLELDAGEIRQAVIVKLRDYHQPPKAPAPATAEQQLAELRAHASSMAGAIRMRLEELNRSGIDDRWLRRAVEAYEGWLGR